MKILGLLHPGLRIDPEEESIETHRRFYTEVLGLPLDPNRPDIPGIPGFWLNVGQNQIHLMGARGQSPAARAGEEDPSQPHVALVVDDLAEAKRHLDEMGVRYSTYGNLVGAQQLFLRDPSGHLIELQQAPR